MRIELLGTQGQFYENQAIEGYSEEKLEQMYKRYLELELQAVRAAFPNYSVEHIDITSLDTVKVRCDSDDEWDSVDTVESEVENIITKVFSDGKWAN